MKILKEFLELLAWTALFVGAAVLYCKYTPGQLSAEADLTAGEGVAP